MKPNRFLFKTDKKGYLRLRSFYAVYLTLKTLLTSRFYFNVIPHREQQTVFDKITASPEVLAEKLIVDYLQGVNDYIYYYTVTCGLYNTKADAITATLEKLKEVAG